MPGGFNQFFENLQRLESIRLAREQQKLAERNSGANQLNVYSQIVGGLAPEARSAFTQVFSNATGLSQQLLDQVAAKQPTSLATQIDMKTQAGSDQINPAEVAARGLTGQNLGGLALSQGLAQGAQGLTPEQQQAGALTALTNQTPGGFAVDQQLAGLSPQTQRLMAEIRGGTALSAPQQTGFALEQRGQTLNYDINRRQLDPDQTINESKDALDLQATGNSTAKQSRCKWFL